MRSFNTLISIHNQQIILWDKGGYSLITEAHLFNAIAPSWGIY